MAAKKVPVETIPEVQAFNEAKEKIARFETQHAGVFDHFRELAANYNTLLEQADKAVRAKGVSCGEFDAYQDNTQYYPNKLYELVGREEFLKLGGKIGTKTEYTIDRAMVKALIASGKIKPELATEICKEGYKYKTPDPIKL